MCRKRWDIFVMEASDCASDWNPFEFIFFFPVKRNQEEENPVTLMHHPRCFQRIPFCMGTYKKSHYCCNEILLGGWVTFLHSSSSGRLSKVSWRDQWSPESELRGRAWIQVVQTQFLFLSPLRGRVLMNGVACIFTEGSVSVLFSSHAQIR